MTNENEYLDKINLDAVTKLQTFLEQLEEGEITIDEMLTTAYAALVTVSLMGYSAVAIAEDAIESAREIRDNLPGDTEV